ncbi:hypothetical protein ACM26V_19165 [Salipaludibacillus sp. HK11]|uniref:hypothetical protein n=1 Tax=Salipaludibacillus sp. HK11 TaxID=3394320 RepID=UPI0039FDAD2D
MRITVQNQDEKELLEKFSQDFSIDQNHQQTDIVDLNQTMSPLNRDEIRLLKQAFKELTITVDPSIDEISFSRDDIISKVFECDQLSSQSSKISYSQYLKKHTEQLLKPWEQNVCWNEDVLE